MCDPVLHTVAEFACAHGLPPERGRLLVGFSGGADSTALLLALHECGIPCRAVHFEHGLRGGEGRADQEWCRQFCAQRALAFVCQNLDVKARQRPGEGQEAAARRCRMAAWAELTGEGDAVALGHHADDALETLILRLMRGSNSSGLLALRPDRVIDGVRLLRPLLSLRRDQLTQFLRAAGVKECCEDESNRDTRFRRNAIRHRILPLFRESGASDRGLLRSLDALSLDAEFLEQAAIRADSEVGDSSAALAGLHPALRGRLLRRRIRAEYGIDHPLSADTQQRLRDELPAEPPGEQRLPLGGKLTLLLGADGRFAIRSEAALPVSVLWRNWCWKAEPRLPINEAALWLRAERAGAAQERAEGFERCADRELFDAAALPEVLTVRAWQNGDRMVPFGGKKSAKVQDILTNAGVPRHRRAWVPLVCAEDRIIWLAGVRRAEFGRVKPEGPAVALQLQSMARASKPPAMPAGGGPATKETQTHDGESA